MTRISSKLSALALGLSLLAACNKSNPPAIPTVAFTSPTDKQALTSADGTASGGILTITVTAAESGFTSAPLCNLFVDGTEVQKNVAANGSGIVTFTNVALTGGTPATSHTLKIVCTDVSGQTAVAGPITVTVLLGSTGPCTIAIAPPDSTVFNESGAQVSSHTVVKESVTGTTITVTMDQDGGACPDGIVTLRYGDGGSSPQPAAVQSVNGVAPFVLPSLPETTAAALGDVTKQLAVTASVDSSSLTVHYIVDTVEPSCTITAPANGATITGADDIDPSTAGIQVTVSGTCQGLAGTAPTFQIVDGITGATYGTVTPSTDGTFTATATLPAGTDAVTLIGNSVTGNPLVCNTNTVTVNNTCPTPTLTMSAPTANEVFNLTNSLSAGTGELQVIFHMTTTNVPSSSTIEICSTVAPTATAAACGFGSGMFEVGTTSPSNGNATLTAALGDDGAAANQTLTAQVANPCGSIQATVNVAVHALQPVIDSIAFSNAFVDSDGGIWLNASALQAGGAATTVTLTVDGSDMFGDAGAAITLNGNLAGTGAFTGTGSPTAQIQLSNLPDGTYAFDATATDIWGNVSNSKQTVPIAVSFPLYVKTSLPTCTITAPDLTTGCFNIVDNDNDAGSGAVEVPILVTAANASALDVNGLPLDGTATVKTGGGGLASDPIASAPITVFATSSQGANSYSATVTDPAGNMPATCTPASLSVNVSTVAPTFTITPQNAGAADAQNCVTYTTRDGIVINIATTDIANGTTLSVQATGPNGGGTAKTSATVTNNAASVTLNGLPNGDDTLVVSGADSCQNSATNNSVCIGVNAPGCDLSLVSPVATSTDAGESVVLNASQVDASGNAAIELHTSCAAGTQVQFDSTASGGSDVPLDGGVDANGDVTFDLTGLVDGSNGTFTADISGGEALPTIDYDAKLSLPAFTGETPAAGTLEIVANQDNLILSDAGVTSLAITGGTIIANEAQCTTTSCADFTMTGISGLGPVDGNGNVGTASLTLSGFTQGTTNPNPITIASGTTMVTFSAVSMPAVDTGTVTLTITDNVGNTTSETWNVTAHGVPPPAPSGLTAAMSDKRTASVLLSWTVPAAGAASATQGYELAYVLNNLNGTPPTTPSESAYAGWTLDPGINAGIVDAGTANLNYTEPGLPTLNQYTFELRAIDAVGNRSALTTDVTAVSVSATDSNAWQTVTITDTANDAADSDFGYVLRTGDFNKDGMVDLVITAPYQYAANPTPGILYILNGAADPSKATFAGMTSVSLGGTAFDWFGQDAHVADYNGDGIDDLAVGSPQYNNGQGRVDIFFGSNPGGLPASPSTTILGDSTASGMFGYSVSAVDVNGDGVPDLLVGAPLMGASENGASYLFLGSKTAWPNPDAGADVTSATSVITGNAGDGLGARWGSVAIGDIDGDGDGDFTVGAPGGGGTDGVDGGPGSLYGFSGKTALTNATMTVGANALFTLSGPGSGYCDPVNFGYASGEGDEAFTLWTCFGVNAISANFTNPKGLADLMVGSGYESEAFLYKMTKTGPTTPPAYTLLDFNQGFGWSMIAPDLNMDGLPDLLMGVNGGSPNVFLYLNVDGGFPSPALPIGGDSNGQSGEVFGASGSAFGYGLASGDFQGISKPDFAVSDWESFAVTVYY